MAPLTRWTVGRPRGRVTYPATGWLDRTAAELGLTPGSLKQLLWSPRYGMFRRGRALIEALVRHGAQPIADQIVLELQLSLYHAQAPEALTPDLTIEEQEADGEEDVAHVAYLTDPSPVTWDTYRRHALQDVAVRLRYLAAGDAHYGVRT